MIALSDKKSLVKGWCPNALQPMEAADGWVMRIRPFQNRLTRAQAFGLIDLSQTYGRGVITLTNRANLQLRGIRLDQHHALLDKLIDLELVDPTLEEGPAMMCAPDWIPDDPSSILIKGLRQRVPTLPPLPSKFGFAVDMGENSLLSASSADIRFERVHPSVCKDFGDNAVLVRVDGAERGSVASTLDHALEIALSLIKWFKATGGEGRMAAHVAAHGLPDWALIAPPAESHLAWTPGRYKIGAAYGAAFGDIPARQLVRLLEKTDAPAIRLTPWRLFILENTDMMADSGFIDQANHPLFHIQACIGAPFCKAASVKTRGLAQDMVPFLEGKKQNGMANIHISGCAKGCAHPGEARLTLVGKEGRFDLIRQGSPRSLSDEQGLSAQDIINRMKNHALSL